MDAIIVWRGERIEVRLLRRTSTRDIYVDINGIEYEVWNEDPKPGIPG